MSEFKEGVFRTHLQQMFKVTVKKKLEWRWSNNQQLEVWMFRWMDEFRVWIAEQDDYGMQLLMVEKCADYGKDQYQPFEVMNLLEKLKPGRYLLRLERYK